GGHGHRLSTAVLPAGGEVAGAGADGTAGRHAGGAAAAEPGAAAGVHAAGAATGVGVAAAGVPGQARPADHVGPTAAADATQCAVGAGAVGPAAGAAR